MRVGALGVQLGQGVELTPGRVEIGMAQVAVGECVRGRLEPDDDGVDFGQGADQRVVDVVVDHPRVEGEGGGHVDGV